MEILSILGYYRVGVEWTEWFGGIIRFIVGLFSSFFFFFLLPFPLIHKNLPLVMAMATTSKSLLFSFLVFFSSFFFFFSFIYFLPFFVAFSSNAIFSSSAEGAGYQITPADGSALRGSCVVARDATYDCTSALTNGHGQLLFRCTSDLTGLHAR